MVKNILFNIVFTSVIFLKSALMAQEKTVIAVYNLESMGVSPVAAKIITDRIRAEIILTKRFQVMDRQLMEEILKEQALPLTGLCSDASCLVKVGRLIAVQQIIGGSVGKVGNLYTLQLNLVDVETAKILETINFDYRGSVEDFVTVGSKEIVKKLLQKKYGKITIKTSPAGASVFINDLKLGVTPFQKDDLFPGTYSVKLELDTYESISKQFIITETKLSESLSFKLIKQTSTLSISGGPEKAIIKVNNTTFGSIPLSKKKINFGMHYLEISKKGYRTFQKEILINENQAYKYKITLKPKSRFLSTLASTIIPGSGQLYAGNGKRGLILGSAALLSTLTSVALMQNYFDKKDVYNNSRDLYLNNTDASKMKNLYTDMTADYDQMKSTYNMTGIVSGITMAIWVYNIFDAYATFPKIQKTTISSNPQLKNANLSVNINF